MASITIRDRDNSLKSRLRIQAAINALFIPFGGFDLPEVPREPMREPPSSEQ